jgi:hypothetical protein
MCLRSKIIQLLPAIAMMVSLSSVAQNNLNGIWEREFGDPNMKTELSLKNNGGECYVGYFANLYQMAENAWEEIGRHEVIQACMVDGMLMVDIESGETLFFVIQDIEGTPALHQCDENGNLLEPTEEEGIAPQYVKLTGE